MRADTIRDTIEDFEATVETERPVYAGHRLVKKLGSFDGYDLHLGDKPYFDVSRSAIIKTASRGSLGYPSKRSRLVEEARISTAFCHPNLTSLYDATEDEHGTHLVFEHVDGTDLEQACKRLRARDEAFPFELCVWMLTEILRGASYAHALRDSDGTPLELVLRDLVPANVLIAKTGHIKLATFGCSLVPQGDDARPHPGAPAYLAPERIARHRYDARSDVFSAGVLLFELLFGRACYSEHRAREVAAKVVHSGIPLEQLAREGVPAELVEVVRRATAHRPEERYASASAMARELLEWLVRTEQHATPSTVAKFFAGQKLFSAASDEEVIVVPLREVLDEDATEAEGRTTTDAEPPSCTLSAVIIRSELAPAREARSEPTPITPWEELDPIVPVRVSMISPIVELRAGRARMFGAVLSGVAFALSLGIALVSLLS